MSSLLCKIDEIGENGKEVRITADSKPAFAMLFVHQETVRAYLNVCPHQGRPLNWGPDRFLISPENHLVCAHHGASFLLATGECFEGPCKGARLRSLDIRIENGAVWLDREPSLES